MMKILIATAFLCGSSIAFAQEDASDEMVAEDMSASSDMEADADLWEEDQSSAGVLAAVNALMAALAARDAEAMREALVPGGEAVNIAFDDQGRAEIQAQTWEDFLAALGTRNYDLPDAFVAYSVSSNGQTAVFSGNGDNYWTEDVPICASYHFYAVQDAGRWRILNMMRSQAQGEC